MGEKGGAQQPLHQRLSGFRAAAAITVVLAAAFFMTYGNATTIAPNWVNTTGGDLAEVGSLGGGGTPIQVNDHVQLNKNEVRNISKLNSEDTLTIASDQDASGSGVLSLWSGGTKSLQVDNGGGINVLNGHLLMNDNDIWNTSSIQSTATFTIFKESGTAKAVHKNGTLMFQGSNDGTVIQDSINALSSDGGKIIITEDMTVDSPIEFGKGVTLEGETMNTPQIFASGSFSGGDVVLNGTSGEDFMTVRDLRVSCGSQRGMTGVQINNPPSDPGGSSPSHALLEDLHVINCGVGINMNGAEDSYIRRGRIGGNDIGINYSAGGGFGSIHGTHIVNSNNVSLNIGTKTFSSESLIVGSSDVEEHIKIYPKAQTVALDNFWAEGGPTVVNTTDGHTQPQISMKDSKIILDNGNNAFEGSYNHVNMDNIVVASDDGSTIELMENKPARATVSNIQTNGNAQYTKIGFSHVASNLQGTSSSADDDVLEVAGSGGLGIKAGNLEMNGNNIEAVNKTSYDTNSEPSCDGDTEGDIQYNGSHHLGCDGSTWNKLY